MADAKPPIAEAVAAKVGLAGKPASAAIVAAVLATVPPALLLAMFVAGDVDEAVLIALTILAVALDVVAFFLARHAYATASLVGSLFVVKVVSLVAIVVSLVILGGYAILLALLALIALFCAAPPQQSNTCSCGDGGCGDGCGGDGCCGGSSSGGGGSSSGGGGSGGGGGCCSCAAPAAAHATLTWSALASPALWNHALAHHPDDARFHPDVHRVGPLRLCVGCFTVHPVFLTAMALFVAAPAAWSLAPRASMAAGAGLALVQGVSSFGWARRKRSKVAVKAALGIGLALFVDGTLRSGLPEGAQVAILLGALLLAMASTAPRARRMRAWQAARGRPSADDEVA